MRNSPAGSHGQSTDYYVLVLSFTLPGGAIHLFTVIKLQMNTYGRSQQSCTWVWVLSDGVVLLFRSLFKLYGVPCILN